MFKFKVMAQDKLPARAGHIEVAGEYYPTPFNIPTNNEENKLAEVRKAISGLQNLQFPQPFREVNKFVNNNKIKNLTGTPSSALVNQMEKYTDGKNYTIGHVTHPRDVKISDRLSKFFVELWIQSGIDVIVIEDESPSASPESFDKRLSREIEYIESTHDRNKYIGVMASTRLDAPADFVRRKTLIAEDYGLKGMVYDYAQIRTIRQSLEVIKDLSREKEMLFHLSGVSKKYQNTSLMLMLQLLGFDTFSLQTFHGVIKKKKKPNFEWLDKSSWGFLNQDSMILNCKHPTCTGHTTKSFIDVHNGTCTASGALKYHNNIENLHEFVKSRENTMEQRLRNYMVTKPNAVNVAKRLFKIDIKQTSLF